MFIRTIATFFALLAASAFAQVQLYGTVNAAGNSTLVRLDPATGALLQTIGPVGYVINGLAFDPTSGKLYGSTSTSTCEGCTANIVTINTTTGAATLVGSTGQGQVATITFTPSGAMYGWSDVVTTPTGQGDDLVSINKATGAATWVGDSAISTAVQSFAINSSGVAYLVNYNGNTYTVNLATGAPTLVGSFTRPSGAIENHHGAFHPTNGLLYVIDRTNDSSPSNPRNMLTFNTATNSFVGAAIPIPNNVHTLAFGGTASAVGVPVDSAWAIGLLLFAIIGFVVMNARRNRVTAA